MHIIKDKK